MPGDRVQHELLVYDRAEKKTNAGDPFVILTLGNASGKIDTAPVWSDKLEWVEGADSGRVVIAGVQGGYGNYTCIQHTAQMSTCYAHQSRLGTSTGASVRQGEVMGYVGNTGNSFGAHLHFEVRINGSPVDPAGYL